MVMVCASFFAEGVPEDNSEDNTEYIPQNIPRVLAPSDIDAYVTNCDKIWNEIETLDLTSYEFDRIFEIDSTWGGFYNSIHKKNVPAELAAILKKYGLGDNGIEKYMVIFLGFMIVESEAEIYALCSKSGIDPSDSPDIEEVLEEIDFYKQGINTKDLGLLNSKRDALVSVYGTIYDEDDFDDL
jgi:hypothetical protein